MCSPWLASSPLSAPLRSLRSAVRPALLLAGGKRGGSLRSLDGEAPACASAWRPSRPAGFACGAGGRCAACWRVLSRIPSMSPMPPPMFARSVGVAAAGSPGSSGLPCSMRLRWSAVRTLSRAFSRFWGLSRTGCSRFGPGRVFSFSRTAWLSARSLSRAMLYGSCFPAGSSAMFSVSLAASVSQPLALVLAAGGAVIGIAFLLWVFSPHGPRSCARPCSPGSSPDRCSLSCRSASARSGVRAAVWDRPAAAVAPRRGGQGREVPHSLPARSAQPSSASSAPVPLGLAGRAESAFVRSALRTGAQLAVGSDGSGHGFGCSSRRGEAAASTASPCGRRERSSAVAGPLVAARSVLGRPPGRTPRWRHAALRRVPRSASPGDAPARLPQAAGTRAANAARSTSPAPSGSSRPASLLSRPRPVGSSRGSSRCCSSPLGTSASSTRALRRRRPGSRVHSAAEDASPPLGCVAGGPRRDFDRTAAARAAAAHTASGEKAPSRPGRRPPGRSAPARIPCAGAVARPPLGLPPPAGGCLPPASNRPPGEESWIGLGPERRRIDRIFFRIAAGGLVMAFAHVRGGLPALACMSHHVARRSG